MADADRISIGWRELADAIPGALAVQSGRQFVHVSDDFAAAVGATPDALVGESWRRLFDPREADRLEREAVERARADGRWEGRARTGGPGVEESPVELTLSAAGSDAVVWSLAERDAGAEDRPDPSAERDRPLSGRPGFVREIVDALDDVLYVLDEDGESYLWNEALAETTGYDHEEIAAMDPRELLPEDHREFVPGLIDAIEADEDRRVEVDVRTSDGERITHEFSGTTFEDPETGEQFRCSVARDVGDRVARERDLERYETIVETVDDGVYALDEDLRFTFVNQALCDIIERSPAELLGTTALEFFPHDDEVALAAEIREHVVESDVSGGTLEATIPTSEGERHVESRFRLHPEVDGEFRGSVGVLRDVTERERREAELGRQRTLIQGILNTIPDVVFAFDEAGDPIVEDAMLDEFAGYSGEELAEMGPLEPVPEAERPALLERIRRVLVDGETVTYETDIVTKDGERIPHEFRAAPLSLDGEVEGVVGSARDVTERLERERALERRHDELETLDRINELLLETAREVIQTASRDAVEHTVCERLATSDLYQFAWVGEEELDGDRIVPRVAAGEDRGYLEATTITDDRSDTGRGPAGRAMRTGEVQVANVGDPVFEPWRDAARDCGFESVAAVPIHHADTVYGILVVYATREDAFSPREQAGFDVLGRTVGFVTHAARSRELLFADAVVELEFRVDGTDSVFLAAAADLDCRLTLDGYVASGDRWLLYVSVDGAPADDVVDAVVADPEVERARVIDEEASSPRVELVASGSSLPSTVAAAGATISTAVADADVGRVVVEAPVDADVREVVEHVQGEYPGFDLLAHREPGRDGDTSAVGRPAGLLDGLTERQRQALETAYRAGYFDWPRESTAEEVSEALDIAAPTFHGHLRKAERAVLADLFDSPASRE